MRPVPGMSIMAPVPGVTLVPGVAFVPDMGEVLTVTGVRIMFIGGRTLRHRTVVMPGGCRLRVVGSVLGARHRDKLLTVVGWETNAVSTG
ncbi:hypothetical protein [Rhodococcus pyridinivorans]|uniref:hypothetical protein n=1 Tax=Rhodococcus pyridinivorans TaxID=103816 RepID=UPI000316B43B|nr:hypothetical protein [Rhodococcus pyridinivorans]